MTGPEPPDEDMRGLATQLEALHAIEDPQLEFIRDGENTTYKVLTEAGAFALRLHRDGYQTRESVASEVAWTRSLGAAGIETPAVLDGRDGLPVQQVITESGPRFAVLFEWVDGASTRSSRDPDLWRQLGARMATIHAHGLTWERPAWFERRSWDRDGLVGAEPHWGDPLALHDWPREDEKSLAEARDLVRGRLDAFGTGSDRYGLIHADLGFDNVLAKPDGSTYLLDFDDGGFGWFNYELAVPLFTLVPQGSSAVTSARDAIVDGYRSIRPLPDELLAELPTFLMARRLATLGWTLSRGNTDHAKEQSRWRMSTAPEAAREYITWANRGGRI